MTHVAEPLVGRDAELALLEGLLAESCAGVQRFAALSGEPGIGKTSLLVQLGRRAGQRGCLVLEGRAAELERELPFGLLVDALDAYLGALDPHAYSRLAADGLGELAAVFPALRSLHERSDHPSTAIERFRTHYAIRELLERLAARQPVMLAFDDIHWSDQASLELIGHLLRRPAQAAVLVTVAFRTGQAPANLVAALSEAAERGEVTHIRLGPLDRGDAARLVPHEELAHAEQLYRDSGGNPFYLLQLARSGDPVLERRVEHGGRTPTGVPTAVRTAISRELDNLPARVRALVDAAAVAGDPFELDLAVAGAAIPEHEALTALDELIARDVIRPDDVPRRFRFRHPLVRAAVYESCPPGIRLAAHERAAKSLAGRGAAAALRAHHVEQSARYGDMAAVAVLREAARDAAERAPASAVRWFEAALRILPDSAAPTERAELLLGLAAALAATGKLDRSRSALLAALELPPDAVPIPRVKLVSACASVEQLLGRRSEAHERLKDALEGRTDRTSLDAAALMLELAVDAFYGLQYADMRDWAQKSLAVARAREDRPLIAAAAAITALACTMQPTTIEQAHARRAEAAAVIDAMSDKELATDVNAIAWLPPTEFFLERFPEGIAHAKRGLAAARAAGQGDLVPGLVQALAAMLLWSGRLRETLELVDGATEAARLAGSDVGVAWSLINRAQAALFAAEDEAALRASSEAMALAADLGDNPVAVWAGAVHGLALLENGDARRAYDVLVERCGGEDMSLIPGPWSAIWRNVMARCWLALGRLEDAHRTAASCLHDAERFALPLALSYGHRAVAIVALTAGDAQAAAERASAAAEAAEAVGARLDAARSRALASEAFLRLGRTEDAIGQLERAASEFEDCGVPRRREQVDRELRKLGRAVHRRTQPAKADGGGIDVLTGRELEVARLVVDRRTNPEIAATLFLSLKTVETHMRNIFRKLDARSRVEVARIVERAEAQRSDGHGGTR